MKTRNLLFSGLAILLLLLFVSHNDSYAEVKRISVGDNSDAIPAGKSFVHESEDIDLEVTPGSDDDALPSGKKFQIQRQAESFQKLIEATYRSAVERIYRIVIPSWNQYELAE